LIFDGPLSRSILTPLKFVEGENIAKVPVLVRTAESVNLSGKNALAILQDRTYKDAVDSDWQRSYKLGYDVCRDVGDIHNQIHDHWLDL